MIYARLYNLVSGRLKTVKLPWASLVYSLLTFIFCMYFVAFGLEQNPRKKTRLPLPFRIPVSL